MAIPLLGRLSIKEWPLIIISITLAWLEYLISTISSLLPTTVIQLFDLVIKTVYEFTSEPIKLMGYETEGKIKYTRYINSRDSDSEESFEDAKYHLMIDLLNSPDLQTNCSLFGYEVESHLVKTEDNYLLTLHRITRPGSHIARNGRVIYLHHGLLMSSDIWVTMLERHLNLPFLLYDLGYDVWLGNNRGNKYLQKHLFYKTNCEKYWDFSIDEFALFDIPNSIDYVLNETGASKLTYIGFSQGSAQAFAAISIHSELRHKVDQMIAISPATTPHGLYSKILDILLKASPSLVYLLFLRKVLMPSVLLWQKIMYPPFFDTMIDISNFMLFNWKLENINKMQKLASYAHLYLTTSVKCVVHWFQIMSLKNFQMFKDDHSSYSLTSPINYPLKNIKVPIHIIYGDSDSLVDIDVMKNQLPAGTTTTQVVPGHEHLDNLWGHDVKDKVFSHVLRYLGEGKDILSPSNIKTKNSYLQIDDNSQDTLIDDEEITIANGTYNKEECVSHRKPSTGGSVFV